MTKAEANTVCKIHIIPFTAGSTPGEGTINNFGTEYFREGFTKTKNTLLFGEITIDYIIGGYGADTFISRLRIADVAVNTTTPEFQYYGNNYHQRWVTSNGGTLDGGGTRSGSLTDCVIYTTSGGGSTSGSFGDSEFEGDLYISFQVKTFPGDDDIIVYHGCYKITELWT